MAEHGQLYSRADLYDIALTRDIEPEVEFLLDVYRHHGGREPRSVLEIACGPGYHARSFARRGVRAVGLDLQPSMIELGQMRAQAEGVEVEWHVGDMCDFDLPRPVDLAVTWFDAYDCLLEDEDLLRHLRAVARNLDEGGLYVIEGTHPGICSFQGYGDFRYVGSRDGVTVEILWAINDPVIDPVTQISDTAIEIRVDDHGERSVIEDRAQERSVYPREFELLARLSESLEPVAWYGDLDLRQPLDGTPASNRMIGVFRKR